MEEKQVQRGYLASVDLDPPIIVWFQYNPASISDNRTVNYADRAAIDLPGKVFTGSGPRTITFELRLHGLEQGMDPSNAEPIHNGVEPGLAKLRMFLYPREDEWASLDAVPVVDSKGRRITAPPRCYFGFGARVLECVLTDMRINETQFNSGLAAVRADVTVTLHVIEDPENTFFQADRKIRKQLAAR